MNLLSELKRRNVVRVAVAYLVLSWLLIQVADTLGGTLDLPAWTGRLVLLLLVIGFIPALIFSWVYELTPEGVKKESEVDRDRSVTQHTGRKLDVAVLVMLLGVAGLYLLDPRSRETTPTQAATTAEPAVQEVARAEDIESIAVLPFEDFSADADQGHLARGLADTVLHMLAQAADLKVAARTSSFAYQGSNTPIGTIARELGVGAVLEGSVQRSGDRLRIIAQLIRASDQTHLWSQTFDRSATDIFAIQDEIAESVVSALRPGVDAGSAASSSRTEVDAYEHYLRGKEALATETADGARLALQELKSALAIDPDYAPALVQLGFAQIAQNYHGNATWAEIEGPAQSSLRRAVQLAPNNAEAVSALARFIAESGYEPTDAEPLLEQALELNPNDVAALMMSARFAIEQRVEVGAATEALRRAYELDPRNIRAVTAYGDQLLRLQRWDEVALIAQRLKDLWPDHRQTLSFLIDVERRKGRLDRAVPIALKLLDVDPNSYRPYHLLAELYAQLNDLESARSWYERTPEAIQSEDYLPRQLFLNPSGVARILQHVERDLLLYPGWDFGERRYVEALFLNGRIEEGVAAAERYEDALATDEYRLVFAATMAARLGRDELAHRWLDRARARLDLFRGTGFEQTSIIFMDARLAIADDDLESALNGLEKVVEMGGHPLHHLRMNPMYDPLREHPRFESLLETIESELENQRQRLKDQGL